MLKKASNFVLGSATSSTYPRGYACGVAFACGLAGNLFEHAIVNYRRVQLGWM
jgi:hypothetical protein